MSDHLKYNPSRQHPSQRFVQKLREFGDLQTSLGNKAHSLYLHGNLDDAMKLYKEAARICRESGNRYELSVSLGNQALILYSLDDLDGAISLHKEEERLYRELGDKDGLQNSLGNQAIVFYTKGNLERAIALHKEQEGICRIFGIKEGLQICLGNQARIFFEQDNLDWAMTLSKEQERICRKIENKDGLQNALGIQANILYIRGDLEGALTLWIEQDHILRELDPWYGVIRGYTGHRNDDVIMRMFEREEGICRKRKDKDGLQRALGSQALKLYRTRHPDRAMELHKEEEQICREIGDKDGLQRSLGNQARIFHDRGDLDGAMTLHKEEERICQELGNKDGLQRSLGNQARILYDLGDLDGAMALHKEKEKICRELENREGIERSLSNQVKILSDQGNAIGAGILFKDLMRIRRELGYLKGEITEAHQELINIYQEHQKKDNYSSTPAHPIADNIHFAVTSPSVMKAGLSYLIDIWTFQAAQRAIVLKRAQEEMDVKIRIKTQGPKLIERGTVLLVRLEIENAVVEEPEQTIFWIGEITNATFVVTIPNDAKKGQYIGRSTFFINGLQIARLSFNIVVGDVGSQNEFLPTTERVYKTAFASYASSDKREVLARVQGLEKAGIDVFIDVKNLRSGQNYEEILLEVLSSKDIFYLFWSKAASKSKWVEKEWRHALSKRGIDYIDPIPLVSPEEVPPPKELADTLHFGDWILAYICTEEHKKRSVSSKAMPNDISS